MFRITSLPRIRPLPRTIRLFHDETTTSFIRRLEKANALSAGQLKQALQNCDPPGVDTVSAWTEYDTDLLLLAMPQLGSPEIRNAEDPRLFGRPNQRMTGLACRRCAHQQAGVERIEIFTTHDKVLCPRHHLWLGEGVTSSQIPIGSLLEIPAASRRHRNLITRFGRSRVCTAFHISAYINRRWLEQFGHFPQFADLHRQLTAAPGQEHTREQAVDAAALYPATIRLTAILSSPFWEQIAHSNRADNFLKRVTAEVTDGWHPQGGRDPLRRWMAENWLPAVTGSDVISPPPQCQK